jgi:hypothetical protein
MARSDRVGQGVPSVTKVTYETRYRYPGQHGAAVPNCKFTRGFASPSLAHVTGIGSNRGSFHCKLLICSAVKVVPGGQLDKEVVFLI